MRNTSLQINPIYSYIVINASLYPGAIKYNLLISSYCFYFVVIFFLSLLFAWLLLDAGSDYKSTARLLLYAQSQRTQPSGINLASFIFSLAIRDITQVDWKTQLS